MHISGNTDQPRAQPEMAPHEDEPVPKKVRIERKDLEKIGYTPACPGCYNARHSKAHRPHTNFCRNKDQKAMMADPDLNRKLEAATDKENKLIAQQIEQSVEKGEHNELKTNRMEPERAVQPDKAASRVIIDDDEEKWLKWVMMATSSRKSTRMRTSTWTPMRRLRRILRTMQ